ncbi:MAG TPA: transketolase [Anaerolineaceae bacterium]
MTSDSSIQERAIQTIRFLSADGVQKANSGHPGLPMGTAAIAYTIWTRHLRHNPANPAWAGRDRFILSGGHGSMMLYSLLHLTGYGLSLEDLQHFRQWESLTPGHPEYGVTPGVETTTGPLGQGFANGVGMAIAATRLAADFNRPGYELFNTFIYAIVTDGDLMEGVTAEAASLAGHLRMGSLIYVYDDNRITIEGSTDLAFTEDRGKRFEAYGWQVLHVEDGNDVKSIDAAIQTAKADPRPSLIICRTHIGFGLPTRQDTAKAHGEPPGDEELDGAKLKAGWPVQPRFFVPDDVRAYFCQTLARGARAEADWNEKAAAYRAAQPELGAELDRRLARRLPEGWEVKLPEFPADPKGMASRAASGTVINALAGVLPELIGGSADLAPSTNTLMKGVPDYQADSRAGRNLHFGIREHAMGSLVNGMALTPGFIPYGATFLVFSDYMRGALRISALSKIPSVWIFTHDSVGVGEDGPTHQPVEHIMSLRLIPNLLVIRPCDANEVSQAWKIAIERQSGPTALILTRQNLPTLDRSVLSPASGLARGAYVLADIGDGQPEIILMASGSEVSLALDAGFKLGAEGRNVRIVSFPCWELFAAQDAAYREQVLPAGVRARLAIEAGVSTGWEKWVGDQGAVIGIDRFGASAPAKTVFENYGFSVQHVLDEVQKVLDRVEFPVN